MWRRARAGSETWMMKPLKAAGVLSGNRPVFRRMIPATKQMMRRSRLLKAVTSHGELSGRAMSPDDRHWKLSSGPENERGAVDTPLNVSQLSIQGLP
jgi:hypothetical protein